MSDPVPAPAAPKLQPDPADSPESSSQLIVALAIVGGLVAISIGLIIAGLASHQWAIVSGLIGTSIGALATALNAPSGIGKVLNAAKQQPQTPLDPQQH